MKRPQRPPEGPSSRPAGNATSSGTRGDVPAQGVDGWITHTDLASLDRIGFSGP